MPGKILNDYLSHQPGDCCGRKGPGSKQYPICTPESTEMTASGRQNPARTFSRKKILLLLFIVLPLGGVWQIGLGAYIHAKAILAQILLEAAWSDTLNGHEEVKPWPWADIWPVGRLTVPRLGISRIVLAGASGSSLAFGPGLFSGLPLSENEGNIVIAGHRDTQFRFLQNLRPGDVVKLQTPDALTHDYHITEARVVNESDMHYLEDTENSTLTLVTCYPFAAIVPGGPLRYLVIGRQYSSSPSHVL
jgi:sortase A